MHGNVHNRSSAGFHQPPPALHVSRAPMPDPTVLILSTEPIIRRVLGHLIRAVSLSAVVADPWQTSDAAVTQSSPSVIIVDLEHPEWGSPSFIARQRAAGRSVIAFSPSRASPEEVLRDAERLRVFALAMPIEAASFRAVLESARLEKPC